MDPSRTEWANALAQQWLGRRCVLTALTGGMNSSVWAVDAGNERFALKIHDASMLPGLEVARELARHGIRSGEPVHIAAEPDRVAALLRWVPGDPLTWEEGALIGVTLRAVHHALGGVPPPDGIAVWPWRWLDLGAIDDPVVARLAGDAVHRAEDLAHRLPHGLLHGDPAPEAFIDDAGTVGVIDWGSAFHGPLAYDVASAVMYADRSVAVAYGGLSDADLQTFLAFRAVVQTWYFADRITRVDLTGTDHEGNRAGYASGVRMLRRAMGPESAN